MSKSIDDLMEEWRNSTNPVTRWALQEGIVDRIKRYEAELNNGKLSVTFTGFDTMEQATAFYDWYSGQGEQDASIWLVEASDLRYANIDSSKPEKITQANIECYVRLTYKEEENED